MVPSGSFSSLRSARSREHLTEGTRLALLVQRRAASEGLAAQTSPPPQGGAALLGGHPTPVAPAEFKRWASMVWAVGREQGATWPRAGTPSASRRLPALEAAPCWSTELLWTCGSEPWGAQPCRQLSRTRGALFLTQKARCCLWFFSEIIDLTT